MLGDFFNWYGDLWSQAIHNFGGLVVLVVLSGAALFLAMLVVLGVLAGIAQLGRAFMRGWRDESVEPDPAAIPTEPAPEDDDESVTGGTPVG